MHSIEIIDKMVTVNIISIRLVHFRNVNKCSRGNGWKKNIFVKFILFIDSQYVFWV